MLNRILIVVVLSVGSALFAQEPVGGGFAADPIAKQMWRAPLEALSGSRELFGIDPKELARALIVSDVMDAGTNPWSERNWKACQSEVYKRWSFDSKQMTMHRAIVFQELVAKGFVAHAMRYVGKESSVEQESDWQKQARGMRKRIEATCAADVLNLRIRFIAEEVGVDKLLKLVGKNYTFPGSDIDEGAERFAEGNVCLQPLLLLRRSGMRKELSLTREQVKSVRELERICLEQTGNQLVEGFWDLPVYESRGRPTDPEVFKKPAKYEKELLDSVRMILRDKQWDRFNELLLRSYIHANHLARVEVLLGVDLKLKSDKERHREVSQAVSTLRHFRQLKAYYSIIENELTELDESQYLRHVFVPHNYLSEKPLEQLKFIRRYSGGLVPYTPSALRSRIELKPSDRPVLWRKRILSDQDAREIKQINQRISKPVLEQSKYQPYDRVMFLIENEGKPNPRFFAQARREAERRLKAMRILKPDAIFDASGKSFLIAIIGKEQSWSLGWPLSMASANRNMKGHGIKLLRHPEKSIGISVGKEALLKALIGFNGEQTKYPAWSDTTKPCCQHIVLYTDGDFPSGKILKGADTPVDVIGPPGNDERLAKFSKSIGASYLQLAESSEQ